MDSDQSFSTPHAAGAPTSGAADVADASAEGGDGGGAAGAAATRPSDQEILEQENAIRQEEAEKLPFVGDLEPMSALKAEYQAGSEVFRTKIEGLEALYSHIRRTRGDGNCFFRSFIFRYLEDLLARRDYEERNRVLARIKAAEEHMQAAGFQPMVFEDMETVLTNQLDAINGSEDALTPEILITNMRDDMVSNMIVSFLRLAVSAEIAARCDFFAPFIMGMSDEGLSVEAFRRRCVEPMGEESDHVHIVALSDLLQVPVRVLYLDRSMDGGGSDPAAVNHHDFVPEALSGAAGSISAAASSRVHLLYRPGHYDILYPLESGTDGGGAEASGAEGQQLAGVGGLDQGSVSAALAAAMANVNKPGSLDMYH